jgi:hypothetical protein
LPDPFRHFDWNLSMQFPRLDLARHGITGLLVGAEYDWVPKYEEWISDFSDSTIGFGSPSDDMLIAVAISRYRARDEVKTPHILVAFAVRSLGSPGHLRIVLRYSTDDEDLETWADLAPSLRRGPKFAAKLFGLRQVGRISIRSDATTRPTRAEDLWFPLPSRVEDPKGPVDIRGIHGVRFKADDHEQIDYRFNIDRPLGDLVSLSIIWNEEGILDPKFLRRSLARSTAIQTVLTGSPNGENDAIASA